MGEQLANMVNCPVPLRACTVVVHDLNGTAHSLDVTAETLYEAVAQAIAAVHSHEWVGGIGKGLSTVTVKVRNPEVTHIVKIQDFENWLNRGSKSPADTSRTPKTRRSADCESEVQISATLTTSIVSAAYIQTARGIRVVR
jgi:hypothetical protein